MEKRHTLQAFEQALSDLSAAVLIMTEHVQAMVASAAHVLLDNDLVRAGEVVENDLVVDRELETIRARCLDILVRYQPVAGDLRQVIAIEHSAGNLERAADHAKNIAKRTIILNKSPATGPIAGISHLSKMVEVMLHEVLNAYTAGDAKTAEQLRARDDEVDDAHTGLFRELLTYMMEDPRTITPCTHLIIIAKNLERIGDHSTNIAENLVFQVRGERLTDRHADDPDSEDPQARL